MSRPLILDLCCCAGLASLGYHQAGFDVVGVDIEDHPNYPFHFLHADALDVLADTAFCRQFDAIHASPPCQNDTRSTAPQRAAGKVYPKLIEPFRERLEAIGLPYIMENVPEAPLRRDIVLTGFMFGLKVQRARVFELGHWWAMQPQGQPRGYNVTRDERGTRARVKSVMTGDFVTVYGKQGYRKSRLCPPGWRPKFDQGTGLKTWHYAMGIPPEYKFKDTELAEGIPPAFTRCLGGLLMDYLRRQRSFV